nr:alpha-2-macroglobulin [Citrobacter freundii]
MKHLRVAACMLMLALVGCDNNNEKSPTAAKPDAPAPQTAPAKDKAQLQKLMQQSQGKSLTLLDASEVQLDGAATLVLTFSIPLIRIKIFPASCTLLIKKAAKWMVPGSWRQI